jgi:Holliday junction resolvasome RuvABC endonuclease subunit
MVIAGVDCCSKNIAITIMNSEKLILENRFFESNAKDMDMRLADLVTQFEANISFLGEFRPNLLVVENPVYLTNPKASSGIAQVIGYVKSVGARYRVNFMGVDNMSWKKSVLANGHADKDMIMRFAVANWGEKVITNQDLADSACIALWGVLRTV